MLYTKLGNTLQDPSCIHCSFQRASFKDYITYSIKIFSFSINKAFQSSKVYLVQEYLKPFNYLVSEYQCLHLFYYLPIFIIQIWLECCTFLLIQENVRRQAESSSCIITRYLLTYVRSIFHFDVSVVALKY